MAYRKTYTITEVTLNDPLVRINKVSEYAAALEKNANMHRNVGSSIWQEYNDSYAGYYLGPDSSSCENDAASFFEIPRICIVLAMVRELLSKDNCCEICPLKNDTVMVRYIGPGRDVTEFEEALSKFTKYKSEIGG